MRNTHKVPVKKWRRWTEQAQAVFNEVFQAIRKNQRVLLHPKAVQSPDACWRVVAWNAAWLAADACTGHTPKPKKL